MSEKKKYIFSAGERKVRAEWLKWSQVSYIWLNIGIAILALLTAANDGDMSLEQLKLIVFTPLCVGCYFLAKHCAYKKFGNKLLSLHLISMCVYMLREIAGALHDQSAIIFLTVGVMAGVNGFWAVASWRMLQLNRKVREWFDSESPSDEETALNPPKTRQRAKKA